ncbi:MAG: metallophosphatase family protein [Elusimicrobiota bacterium]|jgi:putative phosphoesterase|nr:metallophosphatase family protein [Elusimicrobiota bacterium]
MKYAVMADIHSNYEALSAALKKLRELNVDAYIFCGDLVGYGPDPELCARALGKLKNLIAVMGNHDKSLFEHSFFYWFSDFAIDSIKFANKNLSDKSLKFIKSFAEQYHGKDFALVHGSFLNPFRDYLLSSEQFLLNLDKWSGQVCFVGHSHIPFIMSRKDNLSPRINVFTGSDVTIKMTTGTRYIINPGSIGQPRDANNMASFGVFDERQRTFRLLRVPYDMETTQRKMAKKGLSDVLLNRLKAGS